ncbi:MAG: hypothetical protein KJ941_12675 [Bacteroidetes bacterium]|nr:hypothetical protein [Bacteroidota bacterium]
MSKKNKEPLFDLIKSMSKSEKRYFKLMASRHTIGEENNYVVLFDYISKNEDYNENLLFEHFKGEAFLNKFSITKKRLYDHLLNALTQFHSNHHIEASVYTLLHSSSILFEKALYQQAKKVLKSAEKIAYKHQLTNLLIEIRKHSKKLHEIDNYFELTADDLSQIAKDDALFHHQSQYEDRLWEIKSKIFQRLSRQGNARTAHDKEFYLEIYTEFEHVLEPEVLTFEGQYLKLHIQSVYFFAINKLEESFQFLKLNHQLFVSDPVQINDHPNRFFSILTNLIYTADKLGHYQLATSYLEELRKVHSNIEENAFQDLRAKLFATLASIELTYHTKRGEYELLFAKVPDLEQEIIKYESGLSILRKAFINFKISTIHLAMGNPSLALKSIRKLLNEPNLDKKEDIVGYAHLLEIFIQLENGRTDLIPHLAKVTQRFLKTKSRYGEFEKDIVSSCLRISQTSNYFDQKEKWGELAEKLVRKLDQTLGQQSTEYFHWHLWAKSKYTDKSYIHLVREISQLALFPAA